MPKEQNPENKQNLFRLKIAKSLHSSSREQTTQSDANSNLISSRQTALLFQPRSISLWDNDFYEKRRESQLNSLYRIRKQKLKAITQYNRQFYIKLNSQQSHYSCKRKSKEKDMNEKDTLTFRTIDLKESREIFGPICNFNSLFGVNSKEFNWKKDQDVIQDKLITVRKTETENFSRKINIFQTPDRNRTEQKSNMQNEQKSLMGQNRLQIKALEHSIQSKFKTPTRAQKLPNIFCFV